MRETEVALFGNGCFWCTEAIFQKLKGVESVLPGYAGGHMAHPDYKSVCTGETGRAEVLQVVFDPNVISYRQLLQIFFLTHDPTQLNRQGNDVGTQYRSVIFALTPEQRETAEAALQEAQSPDLWGPDVVTEISGPAHFWEAEASHHDFFTRNPTTAYCNAVVAPKLQKARRQFLSLMRDDM